MNETIENVIYQREERITGDEWDHIKALPLIDLSSNKTLSQTSIHESRASISVSLEEVLSYCETIDITNQLPKIKSHTSKNRFYTLITRFFCLSPPALDSDLIDERNRIFAIALHSFDNHDPLQTRFLVTIYQKLTGSALLECRRYGNHWEEIGFQGNDPATDLRGVGLLGLIQLLYIILSPETSHLSQKIYKLSLDSHQHFPFAVMSTNVTQIAMQILREGLLNKECNDAKCVFKVFNWFYCGIFFELFKIWKNNGKTIADSGFVLRDIRALVRSNVKEIIVNMLNYNSDLQKQNEKKTEDDIEFTNLGDIFANILEENDTQEI